MFPTLGGSLELIDMLCQDRRLDARPVTVDQDATPPGHQAR